MSLRGRLLAICLVLLATGLLISDAVAIGFLRGHLVDRVDTQLRLLGGIARAIPASVSDRASGELSARMDMVPELYLAELTPAGEVRHSAHSTGGGGRPRLPPLDSAAVRARGEQPFTYDGWRIIAAQRTTEPEDAQGATPPGSIVVAARLSAVDATIRGMWGVAGLTAAGLTVALAVAGWFAVQAGLRPLRTIERTAAAIAGGDLTNRVPGVAPPGSEVGRLAAALNGMLGQLEAAFTAQKQTEERMRAFLGDVSHELRTPLFGIRGFTELYRMGGLPERADVDRTMRHIERESGRLAALAEDLLLLARIGEPNLISPEPMDLRTLAADAYLDVQALDPTRPVTLTGPGGGTPATSAPVVADEARLRQVVTNLVGNAVAHTPAGTAIRIGVGTYAGVAILEVADEGPGLTAAQAARVFDRFYRADASRSRTAPTGGAGLGLSIVQELVRAHGGRVEVVTAPGAGATFRILLSRGPAYGSPAPP